MPATEPLYYLFDIDIDKLSKEELALVEAEIFMYLYAELMNIFRFDFKNYFYVMRFNTEMENAMLEENFIRCIIKDLLSTDDYSLQGISCYTQIPEEVIYELAIGYNTNPSFKLSRKIMELHRSVRPDLYRAIVKKMIAENN